MKTGLERQGDFPMDTLDGDVRIDRTEDEEDTANKKWAMSEIADRALQVEAEARYYSKEASFTQKVKSLETSKHVEEGVGKLVGLGREVDTFEDTGMEMRFRSFRE